MSFQMPERLPENAPHVFITPRKHKQTYYLQQHMLVSIGCLLHKVRRVCDGRKEDSTYQTERQHRMGQDPEH